MNTLHSMYDLSDEEKSAHWMITQHAKTHLRCSLPQC